MIKTLDNQLILVDGSFYLHRAYHAFPTLTNSHGESTGAIYGVLNMLKKLLRQYHTSSHVAVIFDANSRTFRNELFKEYKSNRLPMPENLRVQISPIYKIIQAIGLPLLEVTGVEADDVIGTLATEAADNGVNVLISTGDKDMAQLVSSNINLIDPISNNKMGPKEVQLKFGVPPKLIIDYLALIGDNSDNIPGVPGVGKKTACMLLNSIGNLVDIYNNLDKVKKMIFRGAKGIADKLDQNRYTAFLSYQLASIKKDVPLELSYDKLCLEKINKTELIPLFQRYEFKRWLNNIDVFKCTQELNKKRYSNPLITSKSDTYKSPMSVIKQNKYHIINDIRALHSCINTMRNAGTFVFDIKTDILNPLTANLIGLCLTVKKGVIFYLPIGHKYLDINEKQLDCAVVLAALKPLLEDLHSSKICQDTKFIRGVLQRYNIKLAGIIFDITLESYILNNTTTDNHDLSKLAEGFFSYTSIQRKEITKKKRVYLNFKEISIENAIRYAITDTDIILQLHQKMWPQIKKEKTLQKVFEEIDMPLVVVLSSMENIGILIDANILLGYSIELTQRLEELKKEAYSLAKEKFNLSSSKQLQSILYEKQKMPILKKTPNGAPSTNESVLSVLALNYSLPKIILKYRSLAKLKYTYTDKLPLMIDPISKRLHTSYHQVATSTGRLSSSNPNIQNIPVKGKDGFRIRQAFVASPDTLMIAADYSQIELRIMAHLSLDPWLIKSFTEGKDVHRNTAAEVFNTDLDKVTNEQRCMAKVINFGLIYGMSYFGLAKKLSVTLAEAKSYITLYFIRYKGVHKYMDFIRKQAVKNGYLSTIDGRRIYLPTASFSNNSYKKKTWRTAVNAPIQGTAADIIKRAMINIYNWILKEQLTVRMIMQVHDELVFEVQQEAAESVSLKIKSLMEGCFTLNVPLKVELGIGKNWEETHYHMKS